ncbi:unnamed protein product [Arabidopsis halleri]
MNFQKENVFSLLSLNLSSVPIISFVKLDLYGMNSSTKKNT